MSELTSSPSLGELQYASTKKSVTFSQLTVSSASSIIKKRKTFKSFLPKKCCLKRPTIENTIEKPLCAKKPTNEQIISTNKNNSGCNLEDISSDDFPSFKSLDDIPSLNSQETNTSSICNKKVEYLVSEAITSNTSLFNVTIEDERSNPEEESSTSLLESVNKFINSPKFTKIAFVNQPNYSKEYPDDSKIPIECNSKEIVWGCIELGKHNIKKILIRNKSNHTLNIKMATTNPCYQLMPDNSSPSNAILKLHLEARETRELFILFAPQIIGAAVERLYFLPIHTQTQVKTLQFLKLNGYGGHSQMKISNVVKDPLGTFHLQLGKFNIYEVSDYFTVRNFGDLPAFGCFTIGMKTLNNLKIEPNEFVLLPLTGIVITVTYLLDEQNIYEISRLRSLTNHIATLRLVLGAEATRARIQRIGSKITGTDCDPLLKKLCKIFPNEKFPLDIHQFQEPVESLNSLMRLLSYKEIKIHLNEEVIREEIGTFPIDRVFEASAKRWKSDHINYNVTPLNIVFRLPETEFVMLVSECSEDAYYKAKIIPSELVQIWPKEGILRAGNVVVLELTLICPNKCNNCENFQIIINVENDVLKVNGKIALE